jgi:hypothetical protein
VAGLLDSALEELWGTIASGDVLKAEIQTSLFASMALMADNFADSFGVAAEEFPAALLDSIIKDAFTPESAAFCRLLVSLGSPLLRKEASRTLEEHTDAGVYPPDWVTDAGKPVPHRAWRSYDAFGDAEYIMISFGYGDAEHAILAGIDLTELPTVSIVSVSPDADKLIRVVRDRDQPFERFAEITLAEARHRIEGPLASADKILNPDDDYSSSFMCLPVVRSRVRRLPAGSPGSAVEYTAADRAAAVDDFLRSPLAASAGETDAARFWAEVLTGYSGRVPGEPPAQVGPGKLSAALLSHVPRTFTLTDSQRGGLRPAVTAWAQWAAGRQGLDEAATARVLGHLPHLFDDFESAYDDWYSGRERGYVRDLALASDIDLAWLADCRDRRQFAVPLPEDRERGRETPDAADRDQRVVISVSEFAMCDIGDVPRKEWVDAVNRVVEELWHDDPLTTWQAAKRLRAKGMSRHDIIHALAK